jgi:hypothetical protein
MKKSDWNALLVRDQGYCLHCGETEALAPNHRANRGMGGVGKDSPLNKPSNLLLICSELNTAIESNKWAHDRAIEMGWKVSKWDDPKTIPVFDECTGTWYLLNDDWTRLVVKEGKNADC